MKVPPVNIFAFTANTPIYPEYISVNQGDEGTLSITVRSPAKPPTNDRPYPMCGDASQIELSHKEARALGFALIQTTMFLSA